MPVCRSFLQAGICFDLKRETMYTDNKSLSFEKILMAPRGGMNMYDITVIGAAIVDVLAAPVSPEIFESNSQPAEQIRLSFGGDALNEAVVLSRMGKHVQLIGKTGDDDAGRRVLDYMKENHLSADSMRIEPGLPTGINIVLIDAAGERHFLTNPQGSLRKLTYEDIIPYLDDAAGIVSFASMFVSPLLTIEAMERLFREIKKRNRILLCDLTGAKNGETLQDISCLLPYIAIIVPNESEIALLTGERDSSVNARLLLDAGVKTAVIKCGGDGCIVADRDGLTRIPAVPGIHAVDSTGAGDTFAAGFLTGLSEGWPVRDCARLACAAASCAIETVGAADGIRSREQVTERYRLLSRFERI